MQVGLIPLYHSPLHRYIDCCRVVFTLGIIIMIRSSVRYRRCIKLARRILGPFATPLTREVTGRAVGSCLRFTLPDIGVIMGEPWEKMLRACQPWLCSVCGASACRLTVFDKKLERHRIPEKSHSMRRSQRISVDIRGSKGRRATSQGVSTLFALHET